MSRECAQSVRDTFLTLRGHSGDTLGILWGHAGDTFWTLRSPGPEGPHKHPERHSRHTSGPKDPRDSCSRPGGSQVWYVWLKAGGGPRVLTASNMTQISRATLFWVAAAVERKRDSKMLTSFSGLKHQSRFLGRGYDEALFSEKKGFQ